jgi:hypothetical protein
MNLFRSEEHARHWSEFDPAFAEQLRPLAYWAERFSALLFRNRARTDTSPGCSARPGCSASAPAEAARAVLRYHCATVRMPCRAAGSIARAQA